MPLIDTLPRPTHIRVRCLDGIRKGRDYYWPEGTTEFQINTLIPGDVWSVYNGGGVSGYGGYIYKVYRMWGMPAYGAFFERLAYKVPR